MVEEKQKKVSKKTQNRSAAKARKDRGVTIADIVRVFGESEREVGQLAVAGGLDRDDVSKFECG